MFEVTDESGNTFVFENFDEIAEFFNECVMGGGG